MSKDNWKYCNEMNVFDKEDYPYSKAALFISRGGYGTDGHIEIEITNSLGDTVNVLLTEEQTKELIADLQTCLKEKEQDIEGNEIEER